MSVGSGGDAEGRVLGLGREERRGVRRDVDASAMVACETFFVHAATLASFEIGGAREEGAHVGGGGGGQGICIFVGMMVVVMF